MFANIHLSGSRYILRSDSVPELLSGQTPHNPTHIAAAAARRPYVLPSLYVSTEIGRARRVIESVGSRVAKKCSGCIIRVVYPYSIS